MDFLITDEQMNRDELISAVIAAKYQDFSDESFFIMDLDRIIQSVVNWNVHFPRVQLHYAVKCDSSPVILRILTALGCGFDVATKGEMEQTLQHDVLPEHLVYSNTCKAPSNLLFAADNGVRLTVFDSEDELHKLKAYHPTAQLMIRLRYDNPGARIQMHGRQGVYSPTAQTLVHKAWALGLNVVGVAFHVGVGVSGEATAHVGAIVAAQELFEFAERNGRPFSLLDIGGGFKGDWSDARLTFSEFAMAINGALDEHFPVESGVRIIAEPGQYVVTTAQSLFLPVIGVKAIEEEQVQPGYVVSDGIYGSCRNIEIFRPKLKVRIHPMQEAVRRASEMPGLPSTLYGPTCSPLDIIVQDFSLPTLATGTWLELQNMGNYSKELSSCFNGVPKAQTIALISKDYLHLLK